MEDVRKIAMRYKRDLEPLLNAIQNEAPMQAPIILVLEDGTPYLVSGNTRLMIARALEAKVKVLIARLNERGESYGG